MLEFPKTTMSHKLDNDPLVECGLMVFNGQYLMFDTGVINIGEFSPYEVSVSY